MAAEDSVYRATERRIERFTLGLGGAGAVVAGARWGWRSGAGVAAGAALMWLNFRWLEQMVGALVAVSTLQKESEPARVPRGVYLKFFGRFALLLAAVYAILSRSIFPAGAVLAGLFALVAAALAALVVELFRGGRNTGESGGRT
jgi:ATP synthase I chain